MPDPTLVVADDSPDQRALLRRMLAPFGRPVLEACDGRELFWTLERLRASGRGGGQVVVITDLYMPVYQGLEVLEAWKEGGWEHPFIVITSFPDPSVVRRVGAIGGTLLPKPFSQRELRALVAPLAAG